MSKYTGYIYSITNEINGKSYIGKTNDLVRRWKEHCYGHGGTAILDRAFKKYGLEHFIFDIVAQIPFDVVNELNDVLNQLEVYYISLYNTFNDGYNATAGGEGTSFYHHSEETRKKISESQIGKVLTEEQKQKCRVANLGKHHTEEARQAIRQALLHRDHSLYEKMAEKRRGVKRDHDIVMKGAIKRRKPVLQYDLEGNFVREWEGAVCVDGIERNSISICCKGKIPSAGGFIWRFKESDNYPKKIEAPRIVSSKKRSVEQYDLCGNLLADYPSIAAASRATGIVSGNICNCLSGKYKQTKGFIWKYKEEKEVSYAV